MPKVKKVVSIIPPKAVQEEASGKQENKLRVAAYCRVSTELEEQQSSYQIQVAHYTREIQENLKWDFAGIYADEGISGTNTKKRADFNRMIDDCMAGKIDMIITKSVSRFARNTVDCISYIRKLKEKNIAVYFEKENVNTLDGAGELLITILGSLAQEESRSLSTNTRWGMVRRFEQGQIMVNHKYFMGYTRNAEGELVIVPEEAEVVRLIFRLYLEGTSVADIKKHLEEKGIKTARGKTKWQTSVIKKMLVNEKYMGDALLQKTYTTDFITKTRVINNGIVPQYYVEGSHPGIVSKELWTLVQLEKARRTNIRQSMDKRAKTGNGIYNSKYALTDRVICGECGKAYRRVVWRTTYAPSAKWRCCNRLEYGTQYCRSSPTLDEDVLQRGVMKALNTLIEDQDEFTASLLSNIMKVMSQPGGADDPAAPDRRLEELKAEMLLLIEENAKSGAADRNFDQAYEKISAERRRLIEMRDRHMEQRLLQNTYQQRISEMKALLEGETVTITEFNPELVRQLVQTVKIIGEDKITILFQSGIEVEQVLEPRKKYMRCGRPKKTAGG